MLPKDPHAALICGQTGCGKKRTCFRFIIIAAIEKGGYLKYIEYIVIICPTIAGNLAYEKRKWIWNDERVYIDDLRDSSLHETIKIYHEIFTRDETLFIIDDCSATKELKYKKH